MVVKTFTVVNKMPRYLLIYFEISFGSTMCHLLMGYAQINIYSWRKYIIAPKIQNILVQSKYKIYWCTQNTKYIGAPKIQNILVHPKCKIYWCTRNTKYIGAPPIQNILVHSKCKIYWCTQNKFGAMMMSICTILRWQCWTFLYYFL